MTKPKYKFEIKRESQRNPYSTGSFKDFKEVVDFEMDRLSDDDGEFHEDETIILRKVKNDTVP